MEKKKAEVEKRVLKSGYTTGVHTCSAFSKALEAFLVTNDDVYTKTNKVDNDDLDVTKGCEIIVSLSSSKDTLSLNQTFHKPQVFENEKNTLELYAGLGVGVVTKKGLKIKADLPAINPKPLETMREIFIAKTKDIKDIKIYCSISVTDGAEIAKKTANEKVGVIGGISILGTKGVVKPVSSSAYIDSVKTEIEFACGNDYEVLVFTLGNSALRVAKERFDEEQIIEVANFVYDSIKVAVQVKAKKVIFLCGIGKMTKVYQGFKNTHNRFGTIDFIQLKKDIENNLDYEVDIESTKTVKGISLELEKQGNVAAFYALISKKANEQIKQWFPTSNVEAIILEENEVLGW